MKYKQTILLPVLLLSSLGATAHAAGETTAQREVRSELANFWRVAEARVAAAPETAGTPAPVPPLRPLCPPPAPCGPVVVRAAPPPTVEAVQAVQRDSGNGHFGLSLFGGVRLFDFSWGDEQTSETDSLKGRL